MSHEGAKPVKLLIWNTSTKTWEKFDGSITTGDIEIGAVELKDATATTRANVRAANTARSAATIVLATQSIDAAGDVLSTSALATSAKQLADDHNVTVSNPTADPETGLATSAKQLADGHGVAASQAGNWDINDISKGTQTNDVKVTLDSENVTIDPPTDFEGSPVTVGTSAVAITFSGATQAVSLQSDPDNTGKVWIGKSNVTNAGANAMKELLAGQSFDFDYNDASNALYVVSDTATQNVFKFALL